MILVDAALFFFGSWVTWPCNTWNCSVKGAQATRGILLLGWPYIKRPRKDLKKARNESDVVVPFDILVPCLRLTQRDVNHQRKENTFNFCLKPPQPPVDPIPWAGEKDSVGLRRFCCFTHEKTWVSVIHLILCDDNRYCVLACLDASACGGTGCGEFEGPGTSADGRRTDPGCQGQFQTLRTSELNDDALLNPLHLCRWSCGLLWTCTMFWSAWTPSKFLCSARLSTLPPWTSAGAS